MHVIYTNAVVISNNLRKTVPPVANVCKGSKSASYFLWTQSPGCLRVLWYESRGLRGEIRHQKDCLQHLDKKKHRKTAWYIIGNRLPPAKSALCTSGLFDWWWCIYLSDIQIWLTFIYTLKFIINTVLFFSIWQRCHLVCCANEIASIQISRPGCHKA